MGDRLVARAVLYIVAAVYLLTFTGLPDVPDSEVEFQTTSSLFRTGEFGLSGTPEADLIVASEFNVRRGVDGAFYSWGGVGQAAAALPLYAVGRAMAYLWPEIERRHSEDLFHGASRSEYFSHLLVGLRNPALGALTAWLLVLTLRRMNCGRKSSLIAGLSYGLGTFAWSQARSTLSDVQATFFLFAAFHLLVKVREEYEGLKSPRRRDLVLCGLALGMALLTRVATAPAIAVLVTVAVGVTIRGRRWLGRGRADWTSVARDLWWIGTPALACFGAFLIFNRARFGSPLDMGYRGSFIGGLFGEYSMAWALGGLFLSPGKGLLWLAPGVLLLPLGWRRARALGEHLWRWTLPGIALAVILPVSSSTSWTGAYCFGPRYLLPLLPFLWLGVGLGLDRLHGVGLSRRLAMGAVAFGLVTNLPSALVDHVTHQNLALDAAREAWPGMDANKRNEDVMLLMKVHWDWNLAAPWAHWRIFRHRMAGLGETFSSADIYYLSPDVELRPPNQREESFYHWALFDLRHRLGGAIWPAIGAALMLLGAGTVCSIRGLDPTLR